MSLPDYKLVGQRNSTEFTLSGFEVAISELKLVHLFDLLELLEKSSVAVSIASDQSPEDFSASLTAAITLAAIDNEAELAALLRDILRPARLIKNPKTSGAVQFNEELWDELYNLLENPDIEDLIDVITLVVNQSAATIIALGKLDEPAEQDTDDDEPATEARGSYTLESVPDFSGRELLGGFSRAFHIISREYNWEDEKILDLGLTRFRQIFCAIKEANWQEQIQRRENLAWQTRTICEFIACTVPWQQEDENSAPENRLLEIARYVGLTPRQKKEIKESLEDAPSQDEDNVYIDPETGEKTYLRGGNNVAAINLFNRGMTQGTHAM